MKLLLTVGLLFMVGTASASDVTGGLCQNQAEAYVNAFEEKLVDLEGFAQGDQPYNSVELSTTPESQETAVETYTIYVNHENEDGELWTQDYKVEMNVDIPTQRCYLKTFNYLGAYPYGDEGYTEEY